MKAYTDIKQSKKLTEILPLESADMYYKYVLPNSDRIIHVPEIGNPVDSLKWYNEGYTFGGKREPITLSEYCIPCWSLAALLNLCPTINGKQPILTRGKLTRLWYCYYEDEIDTQTYDNPVDAVFEMIQLLHEQKLL